MRLLIPYGWLLFTFFFLQIPCSGQEFRETFMKKVLDLDSSFLNQSERWTPENSYKLTKKNKKPPRLGPLKLITSHTEKHEQIGPVEKNVGIFWKDFNSKYYNEASLTALYNDQDSIHIYLLFDSYYSESDRTFFGRMLFKDDDVPNPSSSALCREIVIQIPGDTVAWHYFPIRNNSKINANDTMVTGTTYAQLQSSTDSIYINYVTGYKGSKKLYQDYPSGIIFRKDGRMMGAHQFYTKKYFWLSKEAEEKEKMLISACILALLWMRSD